MLLSDKYRAFVKHNCLVEFLEGTTFAGKTTVGIVKFMLKVEASNKTAHILSGLDVGTIEKNLINKEFGLIDVFGFKASYHSGGSGNIILPHIALNGERGQKIIYVLGYADKARWKKALGGQYGCVYIDEINIADMDYVREVSIRCDYLLATLNPDDPSLPVYEEYINHSRPLPVWEHETPPELLKQLNGETKKSWTHWYFSFEHNAALTPEKREQIESSVAKDTKLYKNKILGLRGRSTGLIFNLERRNIITHDQAKEYKFSLFSCGVDTAYSQKSDDTFSFVFTGFTECRKKIALAERVYNNKTLSKPLSPSDIAVKLVEFLELCRAQWGLAKDIFIDNADQATLLECQKYKRLNGGLYNFIAAYKKMKILDRINLESGWLAKGDSLVADSCAGLINEMNVYSWKEDKNEPEDKNDHSINACQYSWLPYIGRIGDGKNGVV